MSHTVIADKATDSTQRFIREVVPGGPAALPSVSTRVTVSPLGLPDPVDTPPGSSVEAPSWVEDLRVEVTGRRPGAAELVVAQPTFAGDLHGRTVGTRYLVRWLTDRGLHEVVGGYLGRERLGPVLLGWRLGVAGPVARVQRRAHARVELAVPVELDVLEDSGPKAPSGGRAPRSAPIRGCTVNLSEGGLLAAVQSPPPRMHSVVCARFTLAGQHFRITGRVVRIQPAPCPGTGEVTSAVALAFDAPDVHGDRLRPLLFARQLNARRIGVI